MTQYKAKASAPLAEPEPRIVSPPDHAISRKDIDKEAVKVLSRLHDAGHVAYLVGGGVRDLYLGKVPKDFDISTDARPGQLRKIFRNSRTIGRRFRLVQVFFPGGKIFEVSTFRCRSEYDINGVESVLPSNNTFGNRADDAFRRDLTINSLFFDILDETIIDYAGGVADLDNRIIRIVGDPDRRITRDPVRMLRAIRHAARSDFTIEDATWQAIIRHRDKLHLCPISRIRDELLKDLRGGAGSHWLRLCLDSSIFYEIFPFYRAVLAENEEKTELLSRIMAVLDRLHAQEEYIPEPVLLGFFLIPWAQMMFPQMQENLKNGDFYRLSLSIRSELDGILNHMNIKRATKEHIASLLSRLNLFALHDKDDKWPKWLAKKSYFKESSLFYMMYREAMGGKDVSSLKLAKPPSKTSGRKRPPRRGSRGSAFARKGQKGGVFGLRK